MWFLFGLMLGVFLGVFIMCLMQVARDPRDVESACTGNCNQGRNCTCVQPLRSMSEKDFDRVHGISN